MTKIFKIHGYFIDPNNDYTVRDLETALSEDYDVIARHIKVEERDIEEWNDNIPLNYCDCSERECEVYFQDGMTTRSDMQEVRHGKWEYVDGDLGYDEYKCSECNESYVFEEKETRYRYCPYCGAKMDKG